MNITGENTYEHCSLPCLWALLIVDLMISRFDDLMMKEEKDD